ncbi:MAG: RNA methyltransferase [Acidobacteriota bacterium]
MKAIRRARGCKGDAALLEGVHLVREALSAGVTLTLTVATPAFLDGPDGRALLPRLPRPPLTIESGLLRSLLDSDAPRGIAAIASLPRRRGTLDPLPRTPNGLYLYADGVQDPGNVGALLRAAEAAGACGVGLAPGSAHPHHPRALRASAGSALRLPLAWHVAPTAFADYLAPLAPRWWALAPRGGADPAEVDLRDTTVLVVGAEGPGLSSPARDAVDGALTIPLMPPVESLNSAIAAAVVLFEAARQRRLHEVGAAPR